MLRSFSYLRLSALVAVIFALPPVISFAATDNDVYMVVNLSDGNTLRIVPSTETSITFDRDSVYIKADKSKTHKRSYSAVKDITFGKSGVWTTIDKQADKGCFLFKYVDNETVSLRGLEGTEIISVMSVDGKQLPLHITEFQSGADIHLTSLPSGIYLISVDKKIFKIYKK